MESDSVPVYFVWLKYLSWFYYGTECLFVSQWIDVGACYQITPQPETQDQISNNYAGLARSIMPSQATFDSVCALLESEEIIKNNQVFCTQAPNNDDETYCECLQAQMCVGNSEKDLYKYTTGADIIDVYSYTVSRNLNAKSTIFRRTTIGETSCSWRFPD